METVDETPAAPGTEDSKNHVLEQYDKKIAYYWRTSQTNKLAYKRTRWSTTVLGALVTLVSSLSSSSFVKYAHLDIAFAVMTPLFAASLAIAGGLSQAFQWGAAWSDAAITATRLEKERNRVALTPIGQFDPLKEMALLDDVILTETQGFFQRLLGSGGGPVKTDSKPGGD
jgi:hypothetical protein